MSKIAVDAGVAAQGADVTTGMRRDTALVSLCTLFSRMTGFARVVTTAAVLGSGVLADVYQTANMIPNLLFDLVAGGVLQAVLLPSFIAARRLGGNAALSAATRATAGVIVGGLGIVALLGMALSPLIARLMVAAEPSATISDEKIRLMVPMVLVFIPQLVCYGIATVTCAALNARGRYVAAALSPAVNNVIVVVACVLFRASRHGAVADLRLTTLQFVLIAAGTTLGVVAFSVTPAIALARTGVRWWPTWSPEHPAVRSMRSSFGWASLSIVGTLVPTAAALALGNGAAGGVAVFVYAFAFFVLPHALIAVTVATTLAPRVAEGWQAGHTREVRLAIDSAMKGAVPLLALAGAGMVALAWPLTRLVAAVGQTASQGQAPIAHTLAAFGPGLLGYGVSFVMIRVLFSLGDVRVASLLMIAGAVVGVVVMVVASMTMSDSQRAVALAIGYGASQTVAALLLGARVHRLTRAVSPSRSAGLLLESGVAAAAAWFAMWQVQRLFSTQSVHAPAAFVAGGMTGVVVFAAVMTLMRGRDLWGWRRPCGLRGVRRTNVVGVSNCGACPASVDDLQQQQGRDENHDATGRVEEVVVGGNDDREQREHRIGESEPARRPMCRELPHDDAAPQCPAEVQAGHRGVLVGDGLGNGGFIAPQSTDRVECVDETRRPHKTTLVTYHWDIATTFEIQPGWGQRERPVTDDRQGSGETKEVAHRTVGAVPLDVHPDQQADGDDEVQRAVIDVHQPDEPFASQERVLDGLLVEDEDVLLPLHQPPCVAVGAALAVALVGQAADRLVDVIETAHERDLTQPTVP